MARAKTIHVCQTCGHESPKWMGKCPSCDAWNSFVEEIRTPEAPVAERVGYGRAASTGPIAVGDVEAQTFARLKTGVNELDRVLGGGFVPGGVTILGGDPGIGKSTLSLQIAGKMATNGVEVFVVSGEESLSQIRMRAERIGVADTPIKLISETSLEKLEKLLKEHKPTFVIIDSIQTLGSDRLNSVPGSVAQLREVTSALTQIAKARGIIMLLIGHVTKDGAIAGPKVLEHMVDTVLYFEAQSTLQYRILRAVKNRFGSTNEIGVFEMRGEGLTEVENPSAVFLEGRPKDVPGSVVVPVMEGSRPLLVEVQSLVSDSAYGPPRITTVGFDSNRTLLILNILEKQTGLGVAGLDVFVNVTGGVRLTEPAADLGVSLAILSSLLNKAVSPEVCAFGEVGLTGEIRAVSQTEARLAEVEKLGFTSAILPLKNVEANSKLKLKPLKTIADLAEIAFD